jgi:predicted CXXCH cytochrome family protein
MENKIKTSSNRHAPAENGKCTACHSPHVTKLAKLLLNRPKELCLTCHEKIVTTTARKGHIDMEKGDCLSCHTSHYSRNKVLLAENDPLLCIKCHSADTERLLRDHGEPIAKISHCATCHVPHVTEKPGLLKKVMHDPFARKDCKACHV